MNNGSLKVYGITIDLVGRATRVVAAVDSQKEFAALIGATLQRVRDHAVQRVRDHAGETAKEDERTVAFKNIGVAFFQCPMCKKWHPYKQKNA